MKQERDFIHQVAQVIAKLGYAAILEPSHVLSRRIWKGDLPSLVRGPKYRPDMLVKHNENFVIVEVKVRPVLLSGIIQARKYADYFSMSVLVCFPDDVFSDIPRGVTKFADAQLVGLCPLAKLGSSLRSLLEDKGDG